MGLIYFIVFLALTFDFINGFHDAANSIATVVGTRVLSPRIAVIWAAFFNFVAAFGFGTHVAKTIGKGIVHSSIIEPNLILAALVGATFWNLLTWWWGLPSSSSHALIGGLAGAAVAKAGASSLVYSGLAKTTLFIFVSPLLGLALGFSLFLGVSWLCRSWRPDKVEKVFQKVQLVSAAAFSLGHGGNDAQKTMGIIFALLVSVGQLKGEHIPFWIVLICHAAIGLGTLSGGWRIVRTMSMKITPLRPIGGSSAEFAGALTLFGATWAGIPVSTTHTITGAIMGVGATHGLRAVRWGVARNIIIAWVVTIPAAAAVSAATWFVIQALK